MTTHWHERWEQKRTAWDLNGPHPLTLSLLEQVQNYSNHAIKGPWLIPGCGRAHDCTALLQMGATSVVGKDIVPLAIAEATLLYGHDNRVQLECANIFDVAPSEKKFFAGVFDRAMLCALNGDERRKYILAVSEFVKNDGYIVSIPFCETSAPNSGPPFQISEQEIRESFGRDWKIMMLEPVTSPACDQKILKEWAFIAQKRAN